MSSWSGAAYRATTYDTPLWVFPNRRGGRWNQPHSRETQYVCLDVETPYAEMLRAENLRTQSDSDTYETTLWQVHVEEGAIVDYGTFEKAQAAGFAPDALVDDDHRRCRAEADRLYGLGARGILSPSAALPGGVNLTLLGPRVEVAWQTPIHLSAMVAVQRLSEGHAPTGLVGRVRFYGETHEGLHDYQAAQQPLFQLPRQERGGR